MELAQKLVDLASPILTTYGVELLDVQVARAGSRFVLRITIDRPEGVSIDDCARVSREIEDLLEARDWIAGPYVLEVSSPGLTRPLRVPADLSRFEGRLAKLSLRPGTTFGPGTGTSSTLVGRLGPVTDGVLEVRMEGERVVGVPVDAIAKARLEIDVREEFHRTDGPPKNGRARREERKRSRNR